MKDIESFQPLRPYLTPLPQVRPVSWRDVAMLGYQRYRWHPWRVGGVAALLVFLGGLPLCGCGGVKPETQAALTQLGALVEHACSQGALTADECRLGEESLTRLGLDLEAASKYVAAREVWASVSPLVLRVADVLLKMIGVP